MAFNADPNHEKVCNKCGRTRLARVWFVRHNTTRDGYRNTCKECLADDLYGKIPEVRRCSSCGYDKNLLEFMLNWQHGHTDVCKQCRDSGVTFKPTHRMLTVVVELRVPFKADNTQELEQFNEKVQLGTKDKKGRGVTKTRTITPEQNAWLTTRVNNDKRIKM